MSKNKMGLFLILFLTISIMDGQNLIDYSQITVGYYRVNRRQLDGNPVKLNKDFDYLNLFSKQRFAPDEPSSFSYINYVIRDNNHYVDFFLGGFRNHTKGDFIISDTKNIHFGKGNSNIGLGFGFDLALPPIKGFVVSGSVFTGVGPQFTKWTSGEDVVSPSKWGIRGIGSVLVGSANITTPIFWDFFSLGFGYRTTLHYATFFDFSIENSNIGIQSDFSELDFLTIGMSPMVQLNFSLHKRKKINLDDEKKQEPIE